MRASDDNAGQNVAADVAVTRSERGSRGAADAAALGRGGGGVRPAAAFPPRRQLTTAGVHTAAFGVIEAVDRQAFLTLPPLHGANTSPEIRGDFLPRVEPRLVRPVFRTRGHARVEDSAPVRHYAPLSLRRVVALEPRRTVVETAGASSFRLVLAGKAQGGFHDEALDRS